MSELDEFVRWLSSPEAKRVTDLGASQVGASVDIFRNWKRTGKVKRWVDAYQENKEHAAR